MSASKGIRAALMLVVAGAVLAACRGGGFQSPTGDDEASGPVAYVLVQYGLEAGQAEIVWDDLHRSAPAHFPASVFRGSNLGVRGRGESAFAISLGCDAAKLLIHGDLVEVSNRTGVAELQGELGATMVCVSEQAFHVLAV